MTTTPNSGAADLPEAPLFTKKPVTIAAIQWTGKNLREVITFTDGPPDTRTTHAGMAWEAYTDLVARDGLKIYTLEGKMLANPGDWIIRGVKGEYYPCKPDIFEATYSPAALAAGQATAAQQSGAKLNYSVLYVYANQHGIDYNSLCVAVREASAQPAAQPGVVYAELPTSSHAGSFLIGTCPLYTADQLRAFADATHTLRASHEQASSQAGEYPAPDEIINMAREQGLPETEIEGVFRVNADDLCRVADAILAARNQGVRDDEIVASETVNDLRKLVEATIKQGEKK